MILISDIKIALDDFNDEYIKKAVASVLKLPTSEIKRFRLTKKSVDARKKDDVHFVCSVECSLKSENAEKLLLARNKNKHVSAFKPYFYTMPKSAKPNQRPIVVGSGPAGLFASLVLARCGQCPIILERGGDVNYRRIAVGNYFAGGALDTSSNVQFGEGGAGTFSDGKLTTGTKDHRIRFVLDEFVKAGAHEDILYSSKPHIGTDVLFNILLNMRTEITSLGGEYRFFTQMTDIRLVNGKIQAVEIECNGSKEIIPADNVILATGHSARDTFEMLYDRGILMVQKPFAVGARIEHSQLLINKAQYGTVYSHRALGAADYKLAIHLPNGRGVYTFCMCPGGYVVAAASEPNAIVTNGMSYNARDGVNANSALLVGVNTEDFGSEHPLAGVEFQRRIERAAFEYTHSVSAPAQLVGDFLQGVSSTAFGEVLPTYLPSVALGNIECCLPRFVVESMREGIVELDKRLRGFASKDALLTAPETRSSSPIRMLRNDKLQSVSAEGLYPCGEGAGFAGGIMSAAVDGIKCAEAVISSIEN